MVKAEREGASHVAAMETYMASLEAKAEREWAGGGLFTYGVKLQREAQEQACVAAWREALIEEAMRVTSWQRRT